jgi:hypothetical protein
VASIFSPFLWENRNASRPCRDMSSGGVSASSEIFY